MILLEDLIKLGENYQLECKKAKGGIPKSIWETYSAFANTNGGTIILGLEETNENGIINYVPSNLSYDELLSLQKSFWDTVNNTSKVSINFLKNKNVKIDSYKGKHVLVITIDEASRFNKPIYINNNLYNGSFKRNHEGDYHCSYDEIQEMLRDSSVNSRDSYLVSNKTIDILSKDTITRYRNMFSSINGENHPFSKQDEIKFLRSIGAIDIDDNDVLRPTKAGLLMFGMEVDILREYPSYIVDYQDFRYIVGNQRWSNRITSMSGDWSGNLFDFFLRIEALLTEDLPKPFQIKGIERIDVTPMHEAVREGLCNALTNCDYNVHSGVVIKQYPNKIVYVNAGLLMMPHNQIIQGGKSAPRNESILKMFNMVGIGERGGTGIPKILNAAKEVNYLTPTIEDNSQLMDTTLTIYFDKLADSNENLPIEAEKTSDSLKKLPIEAEKTSDFPKKLPIQIIISLIKTSSYSNINKKNIFIIVDYLYGKVFGSSNISDALNITTRAAQEYIKIMRELDIIEPVRGQGKGKYKFK